MDCRCGGVEEVLAGGEEREVCLEDFCFGVGLLEVGEGGLGVGCEAEGVVVFFVEEGEEVVGDFARGAGEDEDWGHGCWV